MSTIVKSGRADLVRCLSRINNCKVLLTPNILLVSESCGRKHRHSVTLQFQSNGKKASLSEWQSRNTNNSFEPVSLQGSYEQLSHGHFSFEKVHEVNDLVILIKSAGRAHDWVLQIEQFDNPSDMFDFAHTYPGLPLKKWHDFGIGVKTFEEPTN